MFALVDCNNFYASCERVFKPNLIGKPVVVLSNNDGCVIARSNESKAIGVPMGAPAFQFQNLFNEHQVHVFSANFALYGDMSMRVMNIISEFCPDFEVYSIDEIFLKLEGFDYFELESYCQKISKMVHKSTGIPISIGVGKSKSLAKVANKIAKKFPDKTQGVYVIDNEAKREKALKWLPLEDIWGIGRQYAKKLKALNLVNAWDFTQLPNDYVKKQMSIVEFRLKMELAGEKVMDIEKAKKKKNIATTRSFEKPYTKLEELKERVAAFTVACAEKLRRQKSCCKSLMVFVHTNYFRKDQPQYSRNIVVQLPFSTNSSIEMTKFAHIGLEKIFKDGFSYKKCGVIVMDFVPEENIQQSLLENSNPKHKMLMLALDKINSEIGQQKLRLASQDQKRVWKMKQEKLSPRYTTKLKEIIEINAQ